MFSIHQIFVIVGLLLALVELVLGVATGFDLVIMGTVLILGGFIGGLFNNPYPWCLNRPLYFLPLFWPLLYQKEINCHYQTYQY